MLDQIAAEIAKEEPGAPSLQSFLQWLDDAGVTCPKMKVVEVDGVRGVVTREPIKAGELVLHIPKAALLTMTVIRASGSNVVAAMAASGVSFAQVTYLTAFLIEMKRCGGAWAPYISQLPEHAPEPGQCRGRMAALLKGTDIDPRTSRTLHHASERMFEQHLLLAPIFSSLMSPQFGPLSLREFAWMWNAVATRGFFVEISGKKTSVIAPLADMLNHADVDTYNVAWAHNAADGFRFIALRDIAAGAELMDSYGHCSNAELFQRYDFCLTDNCHDRVAISLPAIGPGHPFFAHAEGLGVQQDGMRVFRVSVKAETEAVKQMLTYLRLACLDDIDALRQALASTQSGACLPAVSEENERGVSAQLRRACLRALERYERDIEDDDRLLAEPGLPWGERCAILIGRGEKRILHHYADGNWLTH